METASVKLPETAKEFWLALASVEGIGSVRIRYLLERFGTIEKVFEADLLEISRLPLFDPLLASKVLKARIGLADLRQHIDWYESQGIQIICLQDTAYPEQLKPISNAPVVLACRGNPRIIQKPTVAIVGSTEPTEEGIRVALELTTLLVQADYTIASGLAQGVGTTAHLTALINERPTCAVLGNDLMSIYPPENQRLVEQICQRGAIFSEHIFPAVPSPANLSVRNRIISGLSLATIVVESATNGGAMRTAAFAREQDRFVCAIDWGNRDHQMAAGTRQLIKSGAVAAPVEGLADFVKAFTKSDSTPELQATYVQGEQMDLF